ncbi:MAG: DUF922 domain-containing protein [Sphingomicrobium sp.]
MLQRLEVELLPILIALALAGQQPRDVDLIVNTERLGRTKKYGEARPALRPLAPGEPARLSDVPNVAVTYYEVAGRDLAAIHKSLARLGPRDPRTRRVLPATSRWTVGVKIHSLTTAGRCTGARGDARLPRLRDSAPPRRSDTSSHVSFRDAALQCNLQFVGTADELHVHANEHDPNGPVGRKLGKYGRASRQDRRRRDC